MKKNFNLSFSLSILVFIILISACTKETTTVAPQITGTMMGWATLYDEFGNRIQNRGGVLLTIEGTTPLITTTTDPTGKYQVDNLPQGTYNIICTKSGYATFKAMGIAFVGGDTPKLQNVSLTQPSTTKISFITVTKDTLNKDFVFQFTASTNVPSGTNFNIKIYLSSSESVTSLNYQSVLIYGLKSGSASLKLNINPDVHIFPSGTTVYAIAYGDTYTDPSYVDLYSGLTIYPGLNSQPSNVASVVMY